MFAHHRAKLTNPAKLRQLKNAAVAIGFNVEFEATVYVRNWPQASARPYLLYKVGGYQGRFATIDALEKKLRSINGKPLQG